MEDRTLIVEGRDNPIAKSFPIMNGVMIRLDCELNLAFWAQITLPIPLLKELIKDAEEYTENEKKKDWPSPKGPIHPSCY